MLKSAVIMNDAAHIHGGASKVAIASARELARRGYSVTFFAAQGPADEELAASENVEVHCLSQWNILDDPRRFRAAAQGLWNARASRSLMRVLEGRDPGETVVHVHNWTRALSSSVIRRAVRMGFRTTMTLHDYFAACPNGGFFDFRRGSPCEANALSLACAMRDCDARNYGHKLWRLCRQIIQKSVGLTPRGLKRLIAVSDFSRGMLAPYLPANARVDVVVNPIDVPHRERADVVGAKTFVMLGRVSREKGTELFAEAAQRLGVEAALLGEGPERDDLAGRFPSVRMPGWAGTGEVMATLRGARALVFPSLLYETYGMAVLEAAAVGVPAIVPDGSAAAGLVEDGVTGLRFRMGDVDDLTAKMQRLNREADLAERMGGEAYARFWRDPPTLEKHVDHLIGIYEDLLAS